MIFIITEISVRQTFLKTRLSFGSHEGPLKRGFTVYITAPEFFGIIMSGYLYVLYRVLKTASQRRMWNISLHSQHAETRVLCLGIASNTGRIETRQANIQPQLEFQKRS